MDLESLKEYRSKKEEIEELSHRIEHLSGDLVGNSTILDYKMGYPRPQAVVGTDRERFYRLNNQWSKRKMQLEEECSQVEDFIEGIPDSLTRRIFRMRYIDNMSQRKIADKLHLERSTIAKKIDTFLKVSHNSHKSHL